VGVVVVAGVGVVVVVGVSLGAAAVVSVEVGFEATGADTVGGVAVFSTLGSDLHPKEKRASTTSTPKKDNLDACIVGKTFWNVSEASAPY
jgi:hypothetical protein